jgi:hypothetical protein
MMSPPDDDEDADFDAVNDIGDADEDEDDDDDDHFASFVGEMFDRFTAPSTGT